MKFLMPQILLLLSQKSSRRNLVFVGKFLVSFILLIAIYSYLFHVIMVFEGRDYSPVTGLYWTLTVMSTLGFGDVTFNSDIGKIFTILVLLTGVLCVMIMLPFTFIRFIYSPYLDAQNAAITPKRLDPSTRNHTIIVGSDENAQSIAHYLDKYGLDYVMLVPDTQLALSLYDSGFKVVVGEVDTPLTYQRIQAHQAAMIIALYDDMKNTNIASTVREAAPHVTLVARIKHKDSHDILHLAGANHVYYFAQMLGNFLAGRVFSHKHCANIISSFEGFSIAEAPASNTSLSGLTLKETDLRSRFGLNLAGIWQGNDYIMATPDTVIGDGDVLLLAGTKERIARYEEMVAKEQNIADKPVLILGGGTVGKSVAAALSHRHIESQIVEKNPAIIPKGSKGYIVGSAADIDTLKEAGIDSTDTVIVTTHDDDVNIYLTIYCRKLRPEIHIISRANMERNVASLYNAGANLVVSQANMMATAIVNLLRPGQVTMLTEGLNIFKVNVPKKLYGKTLATSDIRNTSHCNVIGLQSDGTIQVPPDPHALLHEEDELILIGTAQSEDFFIQHFCGNK